MAASVVALWCAAPGRAQETASGPWTPRPYVAEDTGNWSSSTFAELQIRRDGFSGYKTTFVLGSDTLIGFKVHHPQHIVRLPNAKGADGKTHAYFAITQSHAFYGVGADYLGGSGEAGHFSDGYWMVAEINSDAYDPATDRIISTPGSDGRYVYEEHFVENEIAGRIEYSQELNRKQGSFILSKAGDWNHPCKMAAFGGLLVMVGQNWNPAVGSIGESTDAVLFYDVRNPLRPRFLGLMDAGQLQTKEKYPDEDRRKIDTMGLAYFPPAREGESGYYHLGVMDRNFVCDESKDCFKEPMDISKWTPVETAAPLRTGFSAEMGGQQGNVYHSREIYAEVPAADEPCFDREGNEHLNQKPPECAPAGTYRAMFGDAKEDSVLPNSFTSFACRFIPKQCDANKEGLLRFTSLTYDSGSGSEFRLGGATPKYTGRFEDGKKNKFFTQMTGDCQPGSGLGVNSKGEPVVYCVSESDNEPIDCPEGVGECNRLYANYANSSSSFGAIKLTDVDGHSVIYRGRGLADLKLLSSPPWGPGRLPGGAAKGVEWGGAKLKEIEVLSGIWLIYPEVEFGGGYALRLLGGGKLGIGPNDRFGSMRVLPEEGISLFEASQYSGRMVNSIRSNSNVSKACGDSYEVCAKLPRDNGKCGLFSKIGNFFGLVGDCTFPRSFNDKASSWIVGNNNWEAFEHEDYWGWRDPNQTWKRPSPGLTGKYNDAVTSLRSNCAVPPPPEGLTYTIFGGKPLVSWTATPNTTRYEVTVTDATGARVLVEMYSTTVYAPRAVLPPGDYRVSIRGLNDGTDNCRLWGPSTDVLTATVEPPPRPLVKLTLERTSTDPAGLGAGTIAVSPAPDSQYNGTYYVPDRVLTLTATPNTRSEFDRWAGGAARCGDTARCEMPIPADLNAVAVFRPMPTLDLSRKGDGKGTLTAEPAGTGCVTPQQCPVYGTDTQVELQFTTGPNSTFRGFSGDADCEDGKVTMNASKACTARFDKTAYVLEVTAQGGVVTSSVQDGINCGPVCTHTYGVPTEPRTATLTAAALEGFQFVRWYGDQDCWDENGGLSRQISVTVGSRDVSCSAMFVPVGTKYSLTVEKYGVAPGAPKIGGDVQGQEITALKGLDCPQAACSDQAGVVAVVHLTAVAPRGSVFVGWDGSPDCLDGRVTMTSNIRCQAKFSTDILLVDGSDDGQLSREYGSVLNALNAGAADLWKVQSNGEPDAEVLKNYGRVIWYTGAAKGTGPDAPAIGPSPAAETSLSAYLDGGGCLLLSSAQYLFDRGVTTFAQSYLGVSGSTADVAATQVNGAGLKVPGFSGLGLLPLRFDDSGLGNVSKKSYSILASQAAGTQVLFRYGAAGTAGVSRDNGTYRTAFFGFPFLALRSGTDRNSVMGAFLNFCGPEAAAQSAGQ
ncbi:MAG: hypothetical protein J0L64_25545 [Acidobacteria bacterium]|nr:hypothetical protein [Acidobacteriota bacterium]